LFSGEYFPTTNVRWPIKDSKDAGFRQFISKRKTVKLPLELFLRPSLRHPKIPLPTPRAVLNEREAPGKVKTARPPKRLAQLRSVSHAFVSTLQKHRSKTSKLIRIGSLHFRDY